ncbi:MAG: septation protein A [Bauldia sp.]|nr:MAG: septation protein A [Bauldia sp.]MBZ0228387.1 septation protein A [Bauldia sp.]
MEFEADPNSPERKPLNPLLKLALELGPLGVFFFANARGAWLAEKFPALAVLGGPLFVATALFIIATLIALAASLALTRRLPIMPFVTGIVVLVFGGLTLWLQDETFIKMKPTIVNALFGAALLGGLAFGKSLLGYVFDSVFRLTGEGWRKLTFRWGLFFFVLAVLNEVVWRTVSTDMWVNFKVFGIMPITFVFTLFQLPLINRYAIPDDSARAP